MKKTIILLSFLLSFTAGFRAYAQSTSVSTDLVKTAWLGTLNMDAGSSVTRHITIHAGLTYNPWEFRNSAGAQMYDRQKGIYAGARYWPWYVFSGWWFEGRLQYKDFSRTGIWRPALETAKSLGAGLAFGYNLMLHDNLNIELGAGIWGGRDFEHILYECPECMRIREQGPRNFIRPDYISVSLMYVFQ